MPNDKTIRLKIKRQDQPDSKSYWQEFDIPHKPRANVISCLMDIQMRPVTRQEQAVTPVVWECNCLEEVCGACTFSQVRLFNMHPTGAMESEERLETVMGKGGIADCGNAQVCVEVCPKKIPLTESIAEIGRETTLQLLKNLFLK